MSLPLEKLSDLTPRHTIDIERPWFSPEPNRQVALETLAEYFNDNSPVAQALQDHIDDPTAAHAASAISAPATGSLPSGNVAGQLAALEAGKAKVSAKITVADRAARLALDASAVEFSDRIFQTDTGTFWRLLDSALIATDGGWELAVTADADGSIVTSIRIRQGTAAEIDIVILASGEIAATTDTLELRLGDGSTAGGKAVGQSLQSQSLIVVKALGTPAENGAILSAAFTLAGTLTPFGSARSLTNWVTIVVSPGLYDVTSSAIPQTDFVVLAGGGQNPRAVRIYTTTTAPVMAVTTISRVCEGVWLLNAGTGLPTDYVSSVNCVVILDTLPSTKVVRFHRCIFDAASGACVMGGVGDSGAASPSPASFLDCEFIGGATFTTGQTSSLRRTNLSFHRCSMAPLVTYASGGFYRSCTIERCAITGLASAPIRDSRIAQTRIVATGSNQTCLSIQAGGVSVFDSELTSTGTGLCIDAASAQTVAVAHCRLNKAAPFGVNITNSLGTLAESMNVANTAIT